VAEEFVEESKHIADVRRSKSLFDDITVCSKSAFVKRLHGKNRQRAFRGRFKEAAGIASFQ
jgi:hypothetical protein